MVSYQIITRLFEKSETRGIDASGYWGVETGKEGALLYHKEPTRSSQFVKSLAWKQIQSYDLNLLLVHARGASKGVGEPAFNKNNHPFTSTDRSLGLVHNGRVDDIEYNALKQKFVVNSNCDSEIILRIIENAENCDLELPDDLYPKRLAGIRNAFSLINEGHMAVALGERGSEGDRHLWLFRNQHRPLWLVDLMEQLGQIFFMSEPAIWEEGVHDVKGISRSHKLIEFPHNQVWYFRLTDSETQVKDVHKFEIFKDNYKPWQFDGKRHDLNFVEPKFQIVTQLNERDEYRKPKNEYLKNKDELRVDVVDRKCDEIIDIVNNIRQYSEQLVQEQSISKIEFEELIAELESKKKEFENLSANINR